MMGHKYVLMEKYGKLSLNYPCYPFLSGALADPGYWHQCDILYDLTHFQGHRKP